MIRGTVEAMLDGIYPRDDATLTSVHEETIRLSRLIDSLRELDLIESGKMRLSLSDIDPARLAQRATLAFQGAAKSKGVGLEFRGTPCPRVFADPVRLDEVLYNLFSNALRHVSEGGHILVSVGVSESGMATISVEDSGPGVPESERALIFERFYRRDDSRAIDVGGQGIGLSIAKEIVMAHGGSIRVETSQTLGGAAFVVELPVNRG